MIILKYSYKLSFYMYRVYYTYTCQANFQHSTMIHRHRGFERNSGDKNCAAPAKRTYFVVFALCKTVAKTSTTLVEICRQTSRKIVQPYFSSVGKSFIPVKSSRFRPATNVLLLHPYKIETGVTNMHPNWRAWASCRQVSSVCVLGSD